MSVQIAIFARAPVPGAAKTRLAPLLGAEGAALLHEKLVLHAIASALAADVGPVRLWCAPDCSHPFFAQTGVALANQRGADLGARMLHAFEAAKGPLLLIGADCPAITVDDLRWCAQALDEGAPSVFLPAEDGGYGLVGAARPISQIFNDMQWGVADVMAQTRIRLKGAGIAWREGRTIWDVDRPDDYARLMAADLLGAR
jgi:rSAM/selenodomain-associated transferase 1